MMESSAEHNSICNKIGSVDDMDVLKSTTDTTKLSVKYDNLADVDDDKCVNNHKICTRNRKNSKIIRDDTDCNVVIDNNDNDEANGNNQTKQLQQQPSQPPPPLPPSLPSPSLPQQKQPSTYGCKHYKRKAKFVVSNTQTPRHTRHTWTFIRTQQANKSIWFDNFFSVSLRFASFWYNAL